MFILYTAQPATSLRNLRSIPGGGKSFFSSQERPERLWAQKVSSKMNSGVFYPRRKCICWGATLSTRLYLLSRLRMRGVVTPFQHTSSRHLPQGIIQTSSYFCVSVNYFGVVTMKRFIIRQYWVLNVLYCLESESWPEKHLKTQFLPHNKHAANPSQKLAG